MRVQRSNALVWSRILRLLRYPLARPIQTVRCNHDRHATATNQPTDSSVDGIVGLIHSFGEIPDAGGLESGMSASAGLSTPCDNPRSWMIRAYRNESEL